MMNDKPFPAPDVQGPSMDAVADIVEAFKRNGVIKVDGVIDPDLLVRCRAQIERDYPNLEAHDSGNTYGLDTRRFSIPLPITGILGDPRVFANLAVRRLLKALLGGGYEMDSFGLLVSLPGAPAQRAHHDALLYPDTKIDTLLPPTTIAVSIPLVTMDDTNGTTAFWLRSHKSPACAENPDYAPEVPLGSALLWDYRLIHRGLANNSGHPRPVLFAVFCRRWWHEYIPVDAERYERLVIARAAIDRLDEQHRRRMARATIVDADEAE